MTENQRLTAGGSPSSYRYTNNTKEMSQTSPWHNGLRLPTLVDGSSPARMQPAVSMSSSFRSHDTHDTDCCGPKWLLIPTTTAIMDVEQVSVRDHLANERTYLAWIRTSLALIGASIAILK